MIELGPKPCPKENENLCSSYNLEILSKIIGTVFSTNGKGFYLPPVIF
jgi:hypothetical protein